MKKTIIAAFALGLFAAASANAVSWDCTKARSYSEKIDLRESGSFKDG